MTELFPLLLIGAVLYFVAIRPQQKRQAEIRSMLANLDVGSDVITIGGMFGTIVDMDEGSVDLRVSANGMVLRFQKGAIAKLVPVSDSEDSVESDGFLEDSIDDDLAVDSVEEQRP